MKGKTMQELREVKTLNGCDCYENQGKPNMFSRVVHNDGCYTTELKLVEIILLQFKNRTEQDSGRRVACQQKPKAMKEDMLIKINNKTKPTKPVYAVEFYSNDTLMLRVPSWSMAQNDELISQWGRLFEFTVVKL